MSVHEHEQAARDVVVRFAVLTLSDTRTPETDTSGSTACTLIESAGHRVTTRELIHDEIAPLNALLDRWLRDPEIDVIITTGGTGLSSRDRTIDTLERRVLKLLPGFGELFRTLSFKEIGPAAMLSRALAGVCKDKLLFALPGSTPAVTLALRGLILPQIQHAVAQMRK